MDPDLFVRRFHQGRRMYCCFEKLFNDLYGTIHQSNFRRKRLKSLTCGIASRSMPVSANLCNSLANGIWCHMLEVVAARADEAHGHFGGIWTRSGGHHFIAYPAATGLAIEAHLAVKGVDRDHLAGIRCTRRLAVMAPPNRCR